MKLRRLGFLAATAAAVTFSACQPKTDNSAAALPIPKLEPGIRVLDNGLKIYALRDPNTASVSVAVCYNVGGKNDPAGRSGFAHLFEHLMFKSTVNMPPETLDRLTEDVGGLNNASTWDDFTYYYETVPANHLERVLWAEAERMGSLVVDEENFQSERAVVQEELRQSVLSQPYGRLLSLYISQANFSVHPYGRPVIGSIENLSAAVLDDVKAFHAAYYRPDNAILVVSGNFDQRQLDDWIEKYFAPLVSPKWSIPQVTTVEPPRTQPKSFTVYAPNVPLPAILMSWPSPAADSSDIAAWSALDAILQRGQSSRLYQSLVYEKQIAAEVGSSFEIRRNPGEYSLLAILSDGKSVDDGVAALRAEIAKLRDNPVSAEELEEARNELLVEALRNRETSEGRAFELARSVILFGAPSASDQLLDKLQSITADDIRRVARDILDESRSVTIRYLPETPGAKGDVIVDSQTIETVKIDIPASEIPTRAQAPENQRQSPPAPGPAVAAKVPAAVEKTLSNGLRVIVATRPGLPLIAADLCVSAGSALDPKELAGLAALTANLTTRGTTTRSATDIAREVEILGAALGAGATADSSSVSISTRSDKASELFAILADVTRNPVFQEEELERARQEALDGLIVLLRQPSSVGEFALARRLFADGPYGRTPSPRSVSAITRENATSFHADWWRPDNAILVIAGDVTPEAGFKLAEEAFGSWVAPEKPLTKVSLQTEGKERPVPLVIDIPEIGQAAVLMGCVGPSRSNPDWFAAWVANNVLGGGYSARLNQEIRIKRGLSYGANSQFAQRKQPAPIIAGAQTRNDAVPQVAELMADAMKQLGAQTVPESELTNRKAVLIGAFGRSVETTGGLAGRLSALAQFGLPSAKLQTYADDIAAVTAEQVAAAAKTYFDPANAALVIVGDASVFDSELKAKRPKIERIRIDQFNLDSPTLK